MDERKYRPNRNRDEKRPIPNPAQHPYSYKVYRKLEESIGSASHPPSRYDMSIPYLRRGQWYEVGMNLALYAFRFDADEPWREFDLIAIHFRGNAALRAIAKGYMVEAVSNRDEEEELHCGGPHALQQNALRRASIARMLRFLRRRRGAFQQMVAHWDQVGF